MSALPKNEAFPSVATIDLTARLARLTVIQGRLGTSAETPDDLEAVRELAHDYMNRLQEYYLRRNLPLPPDLLAQAREKIANFKSPT